MLGKRLVIPFDGFYAKLKKIDEKKTMKMMKKLQKRKWKQKNLWIFLQKKTKLKKKILLKNGKISKKRIIIKNVKNDSVPLVKFPSFW